MHFLTGVILKLHRQICRQLIGIVVDLIKVITVFIVTAVSALDVVDLISQGSFQRLIIIVRPDDVLVLGSKGSPQNHLRPALKQGSTRGKHTGDNHKKQSRHQNKQNDFGVRGAKLRDSFCDCLGSLGCFFRTLGSCCLCRAVTGFGSCIFFLDCLFLPPAGKRVGTGIGIVLLELLIKGIHIGFI